MTYVIFHKPFNVLCQFTAEEGVSCLADFGLPKNVYPVGRLDKDSEGLLLLSDDGSLIDQVLNPLNNHSKSYWVQVEKIPSKQALEKMSKGLLIKNHFTKPCKVSLIDPPTVSPRNPPIRYRKNILDCWLNVQVTEGKNRQVRRMTAAIGHPTLRLIRHKVGNLCLDGLAEGQWQRVNKDQILSL